MTADALFDLSGPVALLGWVLLALSPLFPRFAQIIAGIVIPVVLSLLYSAIMLVNWSQADGGFDTLGNVMLLFDNPMIALGGWVHFLAFDLLIGAWEVRTARREGISHLLVLPCLALTLYFGPIGFVAFLGIWQMRLLFFPKPGNA